MSIIKEELKLVSIKDILNYNLKIPEYQRPYTWKEDTILKLYNDIKDNASKDEYRIGSLIFYREVSKKNNKYVYNIVDGQQRLVSLCIIINIIMNKYNKEASSIRNTLLYSKFNNISQNNIIKNYKYITNYIFDNLLDFILYKCKVVIFVVDKQEEAFQLFDSQNSRGKALEPFDLLKAYHLNKFSKYILDSKKIEIVEKWEYLINTGKLKSIFDTIYKIKKWTLREYPNYSFSKEDIFLFKGINKNENYPYINNSVENYHYDINRHIINGEYFFYMIEYYSLLYTSYLNLTSKFEIENIKSFNYSGSKRRGDLYVHSLYKAAIIAFIGKFGANNLKEVISLKIYRYVYRIRVENLTVFFSTINNNIFDYFYFLYNFCYEPIDILKLDIMNRDYIDNKRNIKEIIDVFKKIDFYKNENCY